VTEIAADPAAEARVANLRLADALLAVLVGAIAFFVIVGPKVLDVGNIAWLAEGDDSFQHYLGWEFFRLSEWTWPPGLNPDFGLQFSSSIIFSDSVPLLALPLKLLSPILPAVFQYTGWWVLVCFLLQAYFAVRIAGLFTNDVLVKLALVLLLTFAPPMLWRLSVHYSLVAQWVVLASIYLYWARPGRLRWLHWLVLLSATVLIHTYLFAMCVPIWLASLIRRRIIDGPTSPHWLLQIIMVFASAGALLWLGGFFPLRDSMLGWGYGVYRLNFLSMINPDGGQTTDHWSWSSLLPNIPHGPGDYEGFAYAGVGGLLLIILALPLVWTERRTYRGKIVWPLILVCVLLTLFALSPNLMIADRQIRISVPDAFMALAGSMRSSGRFFWPVYYLLPLAAAWLLCRSFGRRVAGPLLLVLVVLQIYDTYPGWSSLRSRFDIVGSHYPTSIDDQRLAAVASHYRTVRMLPATNQAPNWKQVAYFALLNHLPSDATYLARPNDGGYAAYMSGIDATIAQHALASDSLYFLDHYYGWKVAGHLTADDAMFKVGDFYVFAPGWKRLGGSTTLSQSQPWGPM